MNKGQYVFAQVMTYFPRWVFEEAVKKYNGDFHAKNLNSYSLYWLNTETGFVGASAFDSKICITSEEAEAEGYVKRNKITMDDIKPDSHVSECDVDFSTGAPVISFDTVCLGHSNVASSEAYLEDELPADCVGTSMALARGMGEGNACFAAQSYIIWLRNSCWDGSSITFAHRGGYYVKPTEVFGPGILY